MNRGLRPEVFFRRDSTGHEIDLLLETDGGLLPVAAKSGQRFNSDFARELNGWREAGGLVDTPGVIVYDGENSTTFQKDRILSWRCWG